MNYNNLHVSHQAQCLYWWNYRLPMFTYEEAKKLVADNARVVADQTDVEDEETDD